MFNVNFHLNYFSKRFSQAAKVHFIEHAPLVKNAIYFTYDPNIKGSEPNDKLLRTLQQAQPMIFNDFKKRKVEVLYSWEKEMFFKDRLCIVDTPIHNITKLRSLTSKALKRMAVYKPVDLHVFFSESIPLYQRKLVLNALLLSNYSYKCKGMIKEKEEENGNNGMNKDLQDVIGSINIHSDDIMRKQIESLRLWVTLANSCIFTRNLANERANVATCDFLETEAQKLQAEHRDKVTIEVVKGTELVKKGLNLLYSVGKAAQSMPRLIVMTYRGNEEAAPNTFSHAVVGKGLTFDSGGLNLKPTNFIEDMYVDKHGACNALSIFKHAIEMKLKINLICAMACAENSIDSKSYKPSDILLSHKGYTVEITNTDAEGRLVLADALSYVQTNYHPEKIIDLATLTGACCIALGNQMGGLFSNNENMVKDISKASKEVCEAFWHLPIGDDHREDMKSSVADLRNSGADRYGGASKGAAFLEKFIDQKTTKWVHLDIAGPAFSRTANDLFPNGATGFGTQTVLKYLYNSVNGTDIEDENIHKQGPTKNKEALQGLNKVNLC